MDLIKLIQDQINQFNQSSLNSIDIDERLSKRVTKCLSSPLSPNTSNYKKKIVQYTLDGEFVREFNSIAEANRHFNLSDKYISKHLRGKSKSCAGFVFKYKRE